jgi:hypothetical protein
LPAANRTKLFILGLEVFLMLSGGFISMRFLMTLISLVLMKYLNAAILSKQPGLELSETPKFKKYNTNVHHY